MGETQQGQDDQQLQRMALQYARSPRLGEPADLAGAVAFLFSDDAAWVSGQVWSICGGMSLRD
jgi:NAD(P)-dependent dehydrogenase (short-subunit alcohol dehydrogenase family)